MQTPEKEDAALMSLRNGAKTKGSRNTHYTTFGFSATRFAESLLVERFRLDPCLARLVAELAQLGGRP